METEILYRSFEEYATARFRRTKEIAPGDLEGNPENLHSYVTKERQKLATMTSALGITLELFKPGGSYLMTLGCCELFDCLLNGYESYYGKAIRKNSFSDVPKPFLIHIRALLYEAMRDANVSIDEIQKELQYFCTHTGCPQRLLGRHLSRPVVAALKFCRDTVDKTEGIDITEQEWDMLADCLEFQYFTDILPVDIKQLVEAVPEHLEAMRNVDLLTEQLLAKRKSES